MADSARKLVAPKKKKRVRAQRHAPFPVPIRSITLETENKGKWFYYSGQLQGSSVLVYHSGDIHYLYNMGFFGKGNLSRSGFEHRNSFRTITPFKSGDKSLQVMKRQSFIRHLNWQRQNESQSKQSTESEDQEIREYDSDKEQASVSTWERGCQNNTTESNMGDFSEPGTEMDEASDHKYNWPELDEVKEVLEDPGSDFIKDTSGSKTSQPSAEMTEALWDAQEGDEDFWGLEEPSEKEPEKVQPNKNECQAENMNASENVLQSDKLKHIPDMNITEKLCQTQNMTQFKKEETENVLQCENTNKYKMKLSFKNSHHVTGVLRTKDAGLCNAKKTTTEACSTHKVHDDVVSPANCRTTLPTHGSACKLDTSHVVENDPAVIKPALPVDPLCKSHDPEGDFLVVSDSESDGDGAGTDPYSEYHWNRVIKHDPYKMKEHLQLSFEEAFFLSYGLGCLLCLNEQQKSMNLTGMWETFSLRKKSFLPNYIAYHHFRSKGWVPKPGIKFGVDYILYKEGPPFYHASYSVVVRFVNGTTFKDEQDYLNRSFSWPSLSGLNRITENVAKELMFCFVIPPPSFTTEDAGSPKCIPQFKVQEMIVKRWVPAQERETKEVEEIL